MLKLPNIALLLLLVIFLSACQTPPAPLPTPQPAPAPELVVAPEPVPADVIPPSLVDTTSDFDQSEIVIGVENNDINTLSYLKPKIMQSPLVIKDDLWNRIRRGYRLNPEHADQRIDEQIAWFAAHQDFLDRVNIRASRYLWFITEELEKRKMPMEIALLPVIESAYDPFAYSHARASGVWQFIAPTGKLMGLRLDWWYDGRRDIVAATQASLDLLQLLHDDLNNDWLLALAAYNSGEGNVSRAIEKNRRRGKPTDFWHLDLPRETKAYVPKLMAVARLYSDPKRYNIYVLPIPNAPYFDQVETGSQIDLAQAARLANIPLDELYLLNPAFNRWATSPAGPHYLLVPKENAEMFRSALKDFPPTKRVRWVHYTVNPGDSVSTIAAQFETTSHDILLSNNLYSNPNNLLRAGTKLMIPVPSSDHYSLSAKERVEKVISLAHHDDESESISYTVKTGDTFAKIAKVYHVPAKKLAEWNGMAVRDSLRVGRKVTVWVNANNIRPSPVPQVAPDVGQNDAAPATSKAAATPAPVSTPVPPSPSVSTSTATAPAPVAATNTEITIAPVIAAKVTVGDATADTTPDNLTPVVEPAAHDTAQAATKAVTYTVKKGETLWHIAKKFNLTTQQLAEYNQIGTDDDIYKGQVLKVPARAGDKR